MADHSMMKLGKRAPRIDSRTLMLAKYMKDLPTPPVSVDYTKGITSFGMMMNDSLGDCTIAGCGHAIQIWTANQGTEATVPDSDILAAYEAWDGYNPADPSTDQGGVEIDVLNNWRTNGLSGHQLLAYADPDPGDQNHVKSAINLFGGLYIGLALPLTAQNQDVWDVVEGSLLDKLKGFFMHDSPSDPGSWGGHCVFVPAYDANGLTCITWGQLKKMTWAFWGKYCDESHALLSPDWVSNRQTGFDLVTLQADLAAVAG